MKLQNRALVFGMLSNHVFFYKKTYEQTNAVPSTRRLIGFRAWGSGFLY